MRAFFYMMIFIIKTNTMKGGFLKNMLSSGSKLSSKRVVTFVCLLFMLIGYIANLFWNFEVADNMFESLQWIVMAGLGFTASENFGTTPPPEPTVEETPTPSHTTVTHEYDYDDDYEDDYEDEDEPSVEAQ